MNAQEQMINAALERFNGQINLAATVLGRDPAALTAQVMECEPLRNRWIEGADIAAPTPAETFHRPPVMLEDAATLSEDDRKLVESIAAEDKLLKEGLHRLGLSAEEAAVALELQSFHQNQFVQSIHILGASMTKVCLKMQTQMEAAAARLGDVRDQIKLALGPMSRQNLVREEQSLLKSYVAMANQIRMMFDTSQRAVMLQAMIRYRMTKNVTKNPAPLHGKNKPGFQPFISLNGPAEKEEEEEE